MTRSCTYHCRCCGGHFTSLAAFDAHRPRFESAGGCEWPEDAPLVEIVGDCAIGEPEHPMFATALYEHENAQRVRDHHNGEKTRERVSIRGKQGVPA